MGLTLERLAGDQDLTLSVINQDANKTLDPCLPHLFQSSKYSHRSPAMTSEYYDNVLVLLLQHLRQRTDPSLEMFGAIQLLTDVVKTEPNVDKRLVTMIYDEIRCRMEE